MPDSPRAHAQRRTLRGLAVIVLVADIIIAIAMSGGKPRRPTLGARTLTPPTTVAPAVSSRGVVVTIRRPGAAPSTDCFLLADTPAARAKGLQGRTTAAPYAGVAAVLPVSTTTGLTTSLEVIRLTIAYFGASGQYLSAATTVPCPAVIGCPTYPPGGPYRLALEIPTRIYPGIGLGAGATATLGGGC